MNETHTETITRIAVEGSAPGLTVTQGTGTDLAVTVRELIHREFGSLARRRPHLVELAVNEAAALAWLAGFPQLMFPTLARENVERVARWHARQQTLRPRPSTPSSAD